MSLSETLDCYQTKQIVLSQNIFLILDKALSYVLVCFPDLPPVLSTIIPTQKKSYIKRANSFQFQEVLFFFKKGIPTLPIPFLNLRHKLGTKCFLKKKRSNFVRFFHDNKLQKQKRRVGRKDTENREREPSVLDTVSMATLLDKELTAKVSQDLSKGAGGK